MKLLRLFLCVLAIIFLTSCGKNDTNEHVDVEGNIADGIQEDASNDIDAYLDEDNRNTEDLYSKVVPEEENTDVCNSAVLEENRDNAEGMVENPTEENSIEIEPYSQTLTLKKDYINYIGEKVSDLDENFASWEYWDNDGGCSWFFSEKLNCVVMVSYEDILFDGDVPILSADNTCYDLMVNLYMLYDVPEYITVTDLEVCTGLAIHSNFGVEGDEYDYLFAELNEAGVGLIIYSETADYVYSGDAVMIYPLDK